ILAPIVTALAIWPAPAVTTLLGASFAPAAPVLRILAGVALLAASGQVLTALLVAETRERLLLGATIVSALVTIVLGAMLVPPLGARGAAAAAAVGMLAGQLTLVLLPDTRAAVLGVLGSMARPLALAVGAGWLAVALGWAMPVGPVLLVGVYAAAVILTRT